MTYTYDPTRIQEASKDRMRFELGDTLVNGGANTCALSDEEYEAVLSRENAGSSGATWKRAKLRILEAIKFKLSYQVDTKIDVLSYALGERAKLWAKLYDDLSKEIEIANGFPTGDPRSLCKPYYFYTGMQENPLANV
jgi:hypothetical protein